MQIVWGTEENVNGYQCGQNVDILWIHNKRQEKTMKRKGRKRLHDNKFLDIFGGN